MTGLLARQVPTLPGRALEGAGGDRRCVDIWTIDNLNPSVFQGSLTTRRPTLVSTIVGSGPKPLHALLIGAESRSDFCVHQAVMLRSMETAVENFVPGRLCATRRTGCALPAPL